MSFQWKLCSKACFWSIHYMHGQGFGQSVCLFYILTFYIFPPPPPPSPGICVHAFRTTWIEIIVSQVEEVTYSNVPLTARQPMESMWRLHAHQLLRHIIIAVISNESEYQLSLAAFRNHHKGLYWADCRDDDNEFKQIIIIEAWVLLSFIESESYFF